MRDFPQAGDETHVSVAAGPLVAPVLRRVVGMLAARADLPLDRLDDAVLVADVIATRAAAHARDEHVHVSMRTGERMLALSVGPLRSGGAAALVGEASLPEVGNMIERLADEVDVQRRGDDEYLRVRLAYEG